MKKLFKKHIKSTDLNNESIENIKRFCEQQYGVINTVYLNSKTLDLILSNTINNEDGNETCTMKFKDIKSLAIYLKAMNDITIRYLEKRI